jgi:hypothetical protein
MGRSLEETYAFSGVHHIFDHHRGSGKIKILYNFDLFMLILYIQLHEFNLHLMIEVY